MKFYSGFSLKNDEHFFKEYINSSDYSVCGFSYGATKALKYAKEQLENSKRVDTLQLFSPIFFQTKSREFKKTQILGFIKDKKSYLEEFVKVAFYPYPKRDLEHYDASLDELEELLDYVWDAKELHFLVSKGIKLEVYLGGEDKIIDVVGAREFFLEVATVTYIKNANHFLQTN
ncbi:pimelyl-ACP methyl ester esterase BioV [Sulfurimonas sp.]|uniref:pimelyl-ACP methyl ester esterase BioV n=1 Tax=Sulfurimonas sp. TaxID=2022749 RepID=UPI0025CF883B|nr:pimelyl-ACP methyl ester esterase BioV [Sulfurimonas sp.]MDD5157019.1 pimelyl-ACP methyl ester esterase BioV [Sulfurimonas sp.]